MKSAIIVTTIALLLSVSTTIIVKNGDTTASPIEPPRPTYTTHTPIFIEGDANFTGPNGVTGGTGTQGDPFIIDGWDINVSGGYAAIMINNTNAYFVLRDCYFHDSSTYLFYLFKASNGTIENCTFSNGRYFEIKLYSNNICLIDNTITNVTIINVGGMSDYFTMKNNTVINVPQGIRLWGSSNGAIFWDNTFVNSGIRIDREYWSFITADISTNNTINGKPIYYFNSTTNLVIDETLIAGQIIIFNCPYAIVKNVTIQNTSIGLEIAHSDWVDVMNCTFNNCNDGIYTISSEYLELNEINSINNSFAGFEISESNNYTLSNSSFDTNSVYGLLSGQANDVYISNCSFDANGDTGMRIWTAERTTLIDISAYFNEITGIQLSGKSCVLKNITTNYNDIGLQITSENNYITRIISSDNLGYGIYCTGNNNTLDNCTTVKNLIGIYFENGYNNTIQDSEISLCNQGVYLDVSLNNTIINCTLQNNTVGYSSLSTSGNIIRNSAVLNNNFGMSFESSTNNMVYENTIVNCSGYAWDYNHTDYSNEIIYQNDANWSNYTSFEEMLATGQLGSEPLYTKQVNVSNATRFYTHIIGQFDVVDLDLGIFLDGKDGNPIDGVTQTGEFVGMCADFDSDEEVTMDFPANGVYLIRVFGFDVTGNPGHFDMTVEVSSANSTAILFQNSTACTVVGNNITDSTVGIDMDPLSTGNRIYHNNFMSNGIHAIDEGSNSWDDGFPSGGNHWDNWTTPDGDMNGFVDVPFVVGPISMDNFPFTQPWNLDTMPPTAEAGANMTIYQGENAALNGSTSSDDVGVVNYTWIFSYGGTTYTLYGMFANSTFYLVGNYSINLTVRDAVGLTGTDQTWINVQNAPDPVADAGPDQTIDQGTTAFLNGSGSTGSLALVNYTWAFTYNGMAQTLYGAEANFTFYVPGSYSVNLTVMDIAGDFGIDQAWINVRDTIQPFADAGPDRTIAQGESATFNGSGSFDNVGVANYSWTFTYNGTAYSLYGTGPTFAFYAVGNFSVNLTVRDAAGNYDMDSMWVNVRDTTAPTIVSVSPTGAGVAVNAAITIVFSEPMDRATVEGAITISPSIGTPTYTWSDDNEILNVSSFSKFAYDTFYNVNIGTGAKDVSGNNLSSAFMWNFTTEKETVVLPLSEPPYYLIVALVAIIAAIAIVAVFWMRKRKPKNEGKSPPTGQSP